MKSYALAIIIAAIQVKTQTAQSMDMAKDDPFAIMPEKKIERMTSFCDGTTIKYDGLWNPSRLDVRKMEKFQHDKIIDLLELASVDGNKDIEKWHRQYAGIFYNNRKAILARYTATYMIGDDEIWRSEPIIVCDANFGHLWFLYDVDTHKLIGTTKEHGCKSHSGKNFKDTQCLGTTSKP